MCIQATKYVDYFIVKQIFKGNRDKFNFEIEIVQVVESVVCESS